MKKITSILLFVLVFTSTIFAQTFSNTNGRAGQQNFNRLGISSVGNSGDLQICGPSSLGQGGPTASVSGLNYNYQTAQLTIDSLPLSNQSVVFNVDTTVSDTVRLVFGKTNIIKTVYATRTLVLLLPAAPNAIWALGGSQLDNFVTKVKFNSAVTNASVVQYNLAGNEITAAYAAASIPLNAIQEYFYITAAAKYY